MIVANIEIPSDLFLIAKNSNTVAISPIISFQCSATISEVGKAITIINASVSHLFFNIEDIIRDAPVWRRCM